MAASTTSKFLPSAKFLDKLKAGKDAQQKLKLVDQILKELEMISYFHEKVPDSLADSDWARLVNSTGVAERVKMLEYTARNQRSDQLIKARKDEELKEYKERLRIEQEKFDQGKMGYGPYMYQLLLNPARTPRYANLINAFKQFTTRMLAETPKIAFDCQYIPKMTVTEASKMGQQLSLCMNENSTGNRRPFHFEFLNLDLQEPPTVDPITQVRSSLTKLHAHQTILPDVYKDMHYSYQDKNVYYVSKYAQKFFDGPLDPEKTIILPVSFDSEFQSRNFVRKTKWTPIYLPIRKYVKWESGGFHLPLPNIYRALKIVAETGGDWKTAIESNVAYRHKLTIEQRREKLQAMYDFKLQQKNQRQELIDMLENTFNRKARN